jgi:hypothetical protein
MAPQCDVQRDWCRWAMMYELLTALLMRDILMLYGLSPVSWTPSGVVIYRLKQIRISRECE